MCDCYPRKFFCRLSHGMNYYHVTITNGPTNLVQYADRQSPGLASTVLRTSRPGGPASKRLRSLLRSMQPGGQAGFKDKANARKMDHIALDLLSSASMHFAVSILALHWSLPSPRFTGPANGCIATVIPLAEETCGRPKEIFKSWRLTMIKMKI